VGITTNNHHYPFGRVIPQAFSSFDSRMTSLLHFDSSGCCVQFQSSIGALFLFRMSGDQKSNPSRPRPFSILRSMLSCSVE